MFRRFGDIAHRVTIYWYLTHSNERSLGAISMLALALGAVAVVLVTPRTSALVEIALVVVPVSAVVIVGMAD